jgi:hypothetical protein
VQIFNVDRNDLKGSTAGEARKNWMVAVQRWAVLNSIDAQLKIFVGRGDYTFEVHFDPPLTEPTLSQFQVELDTLVSSGLSHGEIVFTYL